MTILPVAARWFCLTNSSSFLGGEGMTLGKAGSAHSWQLFHCYRVSSLRNPGTATPRVIGLISAAFTVGLKEII